MGLLLRFRLTRSLMQAVVVALEGNARLCPEALDHLTGLAQAPNTLARGVERQAIGPVLALKPGGSQAKVKPSPRDQIKRRSHLGQHGGMAVGVAGYHQAKAQSLRLRRQGRQYSPALQDGTLTLLLRP